MNAHIKKHVQYLLITVLVSLSGTIALGDDLNAPLFRGLPLSVHAHWQLATDGTNNLELIDFSWVDDSDPTTYLDPFLPPSDIVSPGAANQYLFDLPNIIDDLPVKYFRLQLTWTFTPDPPLDILLSGQEDTGTGIVGVPAIFVGSSGVLPGTDPGTYFQSYDYEFYPNPDFERWAVFLPDNALLVQAVVDTISTVPEPASLSVLALGSLILFGKRK